MRKRAVDTSGRPKRARRLSLIRVRSVIVCSGVRACVRISFRPTLFSQAQLAMLTALNDYLRDELEENETRHDRAFGDILGRLQASQREVERMRAEHEMFMLGRKVCGCARVFGLYVVAAACRHR